MGLGGVLEQFEPVPAGDVEDRRQVRGLAVKVDRKDAARAWADRRLDPLGVDIVGGGIGLDRHRRRAGLADREPGRDIGVGGDDDLVALADPKGAQGQSERVEAVADADAITRCRNSAA